MTIKFLCVSCNTKLSELTPPVPHCDYNFVPIAEQDVDSPWDVTPSGGLTLNNVKSGTYMVGKVYTFAWRVV